MPFIKNGDQLTAPRRSAIQRALWAIVSSLIVLSWACSLPGLVDEPTPSLVVESLASPTLPPPTATPEPQPPALVEVDPPPGTGLPLKPVVKFYFNQPMDRDSVASAISSSADEGGEFSWIDDATLVFNTLSDLTPDSEINFEFASSARSQNGQPLREPIRLTYRTTGFLRVEQMLPEPDSDEIDPTSAIVVSFNRPVVPLGAPPETLPVAFLIDPPAQGHSDWLNTSTYIFYPEPALDGGQTYTVRVNPGLSSVDGGPLEDAALWSFSTALPQLTSVEPSIGQGPIDLDAEFTLSFNQPMDTSSVESAFEFFAPSSSPVAGKFTWSENDTRLTFAPLQLLERNTRYRLLLDRRAAGRGGTVLGKAAEFAWRTVPDLAVYATSPVQGGVKPLYGSISFTFSGPIEDQGLKDYLTVVPSVADLNFWWNAQERTLNIYGTFESDTNYSLRLSGALHDPWGGSLGKDFTLDFHTAPPEPSLLVNNISDVLFLTPQDHALRVQATNIFDLPLAIGSVSVEDFIGMVSGPDAYSKRQSYRPADQVVWQQSLDLPRNRNTTVDLPLTPDGKDLQPGLYSMRFNLPYENIYKGPYLIVVSNIHIVIKLSAKEVLLWAVDLRSQSALKNASVMVYDSEGNALAGGQTDDEGIFRSGIAELENPYDTYYAVVGRPGQDNFGLALSTWDFGTSSWDFGISSDFSGPRTRAYIYTDRPIYRPGQTVYFRAVVRQAYNGRYEMPLSASLPLKLYKGYGEEIASYDLPLSAFGTAHGAYALPPDAEPGVYRLAGDESAPGVSVSFEVASYRKPEIDLDVNFPASQFQAGEPLQARIAARYFFDAPAGNLPLKWALYATPATFSIPGYFVGKDDLRWTEPFWYPFGGFGLGELIEEGQAETDPQGLLVLDLLPPLKDSRQRFTLEVTIRDASGLPVSARAYIESNPAAFYIGARPDTWIGRSGNSIGFDVQTVDWFKNSIAATGLRAEFNKVDWIQEQDGAAQFPGWPRLVPQYTLISSTDFATNDMGQARLAFTPSEPGTYQLALTGSGARTELMVWVGGSGQAVWPNLPNQRLRLVSDRERYLPGDEAQVFIPNPFNSKAIALLSVERGVVLRYQIEQIPPGGSSVSIPLSTDDAPNVYLAATLLGRGDQGQLDYRQGYLNLPVDPSEQELNVTITSVPQRAGPGDEVSFDVTVTDHTGRPVQGEFSLSVVDEAALALADPNAPDIEQAFYGEQPLGVRTGLALAAYAIRQSLPPGGAGGGGGAEEIPSVVREQFPDTAYWNAEIVTDEMGHAQVSLALPDSLTTWQVLTRGVTQDTQVGQAQTQLVTTKDLLVRPVTPRFFVAGDHVQLSAIVHNNADRELLVDVALQAKGFDLDDPGASSQRATLQPGTPLQFSWWGTVNETQVVDLVFTAKADNLSDTTRPAQGALPVLRYTAPQTFRTAGLLDQGGEVLELVSLPRSYHPQGGSLTVELSSSLASVVLDALEVLENYPYQCTEQTLSRFLPNLETYRVMQAFNVAAPALQTRLERTLDSGISQLLARQNEDGGWGWWQSSESDPLMTAYVVLGFSRAQAVGVVLPQEALSRAVNYLYATLVPPQMTLETGQLDRIAFVLFALHEAGEQPSSNAEALFAERARLSPWAMALLSLTLQDSAPQMSQTLFSNLESTAKRTATGVYWTETVPQMQNLSTPVATTAMVLYALAQHDPSSPLVADAVRYLAAHRGVDGAWSSTYSTAWTVMAFAEVMRGTGEVGGDFDFTAEINAMPLADGQAAGDGTAVQASVSIKDLYLDYPNALTIRRSAGSGRLYYNAGLQISRPAQDVESLDRGVHIERVYDLQDNACSDEPCQIAQAQVGDIIRVRLSLVLPEPAYNLVIEDYLPAGAEVVDTQLKTSQQGAVSDEQLEPVQLFEDSHPFAEGWGWWYFTPPQIYDDHVAWAAEYLPAGTYQLTYLLVPYQPGEFQVLPARAWQFYFPEVQGNSAGAVFTIMP